MWITSLAPLFFLCYNKTSQILPKNKMLYEPPKTKKYIIIFGTAALFLAVLVIVAAPLIYKNKTIQTPTASLPATSEQQKIQEEFKKLEAMRKDSETPAPEAIQKEFAELEKQRKESNATPPTQEQIQKEFKKLEQMRR